MEEAIQELTRRLIAVGVDPNKAPEVAVSALAGAQHPAEDARAEALRKLLEGKP